MKSNRGGNNLVSEKYGKLPKELHALAQVVNNYLNSVTYTARKNDRTEKQREGSQDLFKKSILGQLADKKVKAAYRKLKKDHPLKNDVAKANEVLKFMEQNDQAQVLSKDQRSQPAQAISPELQENENLLEELDHLEKEISNTENQKNNQRQEEELHQVTLQLKKSTYLYLKNTVAVIRSNLESLKAMRTTTETPQELEERIETKSKDLRIKEEELASLKNELEAAGIVLPEEPITNTQQQQPTTDTLGGADEELSVTPASDLTEEEIAQRVAEYFARYENPQVLQSISNEPDPNSEGPRNQEQIHTSAQTSEQQPSNPLNAGAEEIPSTEELLGQWDNLDAMLGQHLNETIPGDDNPDRAESNLERPTEESHTPLNDPSDKKEPQQDNVSQSNDDFDSWEIADEEYPNQGFDDWETESTPAKTQIEPISPLEQLKEDIKNHKTRKIHKDVMKEALTEVDKFINAEIAISDPSKFNIELKNEEPSTRTLFTQLKTIGFKLDNDRQNLLKEIEDTFSYRFMEKPEREKFQAEVAAERKKILNHKKSPTSETAGATPEATTSNTKKPPIIIDKTFKNGEKLIDRITRTTTTTKDTEKRLKEITKYQNEAGKALEKNSSKPLQDQMKIVKSYQSLLKAKVEIIKLQETKVKKEENLGELGNRIETQRKHVNEAQQNLEEEGRPLPAIAADISTHLTQLENTITRLKIGKTLINPKTELGKYSQTAEKKTTDQPVPIQRDTLTAETLNNQASNAKEQGYEFMPSEPPQTVNYNKMPSGETINREENTTATPPSNLDAQQPTTASPNYTGIPEPHPENTNQESETPRELLTMQEQQPEIIQQLRDRLKQRVDTQLPPTKADLEKMSAGEINNLLFKKYSDLKDNHYWLTLSHQYNIPNLNTIVEKCCTSLKVSIKNISEGGDPDQTILNEGKQYIAELKTEIIKALDQVADQSDDTIKRVCDNLGNYVNVFTVLQPLPFSLLFTSRTIKLCHEQLNSPQTKPVLPEEYRESIKKWIADKADLSSTQIGDMNRWIQDWYQFFYNDNTQANLTPNDIQNEFYINDQRIADTEEKLLQLVHQLNGPSFRNFRNRPELFDPNSTDEMIKEIEQAIKIIDNKTELEGSFITNDELKDIATLHQIKFSITALYHYNVVKNILVHYANPRKITFPKTPTDEPKNLHSKFTPPRLTYEQLILKEDFPRVPTHTPGVEDAVVPPDVEVENAPPPPPDDGRDSVSNTRQNAVPESQTAPEETSHMDQSESDNYYSPEASSDEQSHVEPNPTVVRGDPNPQPDTNAGPDRSLPPDSNLGANTEPNPPVESVQPNADNVSIPDDRRDDSQPEEVVDESEVHRDNLSQSSGSESEAEQPEPDQENVGEEIEAPLQAAINAIVRNNDHTQLAAFVAAARNNPTINNCRATLATIGCDDAVAQALQDADVPDLLNAAVLHMQNNNIAQQAAIAAIGRNNDHGHLVNFAAAARNPGTIIGCRAALQALGYNDTVTKVLQDEDLPDLLNATLLRLQNTNIAQRVAIAAIERNRDHAQLTAFVTAARNSRGNIDNCRATLRTIGYDDTVAQVLQNGDVNALLQAAMQNLQNNHIAQRAAIVSIQGNHNPAQLADFVTAARNNPGNVANCRVALAAVGYDDTILVLQNADVANLLTTAEQTLRPIILGEARQAQAITIANINDHQKLDLIITTFEANNLVNSRNLLNELGYADTLNLLQQADFTELANTAKHQNELLHIENQFIGQAATDRLDAIYRFANANANNSGGLITRMTANPQPNDPAINFAPGTEFTPEQIARIGQSARASYISKHADEVNRNPRPTVDEGIQFRNLQQQNVTATNLHSLKKLLQNQISTPPIDDPAGQAAQLTQLRQRALQDLDVLIKQILNHDPNAVAPALPVLLDTANIQRSLDALSHNLNNIHLIRNEQRDNREYKELNESEKPRILTNQVFNKRKEAFQIEFDAFAALKKYCTKNYELPIHQPIPHPDIFFRESTSLSDDEKKRLKNTLGRYAAFIMHVQATDPRNYQSDEIAKQKIREMREQCISRWRQLAAYEMHLNSKEATKEYSQKELNELLPKVQALLSKLSLLLTANGKLDVAQLAPDRTLPKVAEKTTRIAQNDDDVPAAITRALNSFGIVRGPQIVEAGNATLQAPLNNNAPDIRRADNFNNVFVNHLLHETSPKPTQVEVEGQVQPVHVRVDVACVNRVEGDYFKSTLRRGPETLDKHFKSRIFGVAGKPPLPCTLPSKEHLITAKRHIDSILQQFPEKTMTPMEMTTGFTKNEMEAVMIYVEYLRRFENRTDLEIKLPKNLPKNVHISISDRQMELFHKKLQEPTFHNLFNDTAAHAKILGKDTKKILEESTKEKPKNHF